MYTERKLIACFNELARQQPCWW